MWVLTHQIKPIVKNANEYFIERCFSYLYYMVLFMEPSFNRSQQISLTVHIHIDKFQTTGICLPQHPTKEQAVLQLMELLVLFHWKRETNVVLAYVSVRMCSKYKNMSKHVPSLLQIVIFYLHGTSSLLMCSTTVLKISCWT